MVRFVGATKVIHDIGGDSRERGISGSDDEGSFLLRRRFCRLSIGGGGGEVATTEENEERDTFIHVVYITPVCGF